MNKYILYMIMLIHCTSLGNDQWIKKPAPLTYQSHSFAYKTGHFFGDIILDVLQLNANLFSVQSAKVITGFMPFFLATRWLDESIQHNFYDPAHHKNIRQFPDKCHKAAQHGIALPMVFLSGLWLYGWNEDLRQTGRMVALGLPFVHWGKNIIKNLRFKCCLRPWHEKFSSKKRSSGGFPSGHMANITYMTSLLWMRHGPAWGVPLSLFSLLVFTDFLNCNRHYTSQLIAGAGLGLLFAYAANTIVQKRLDENLQCICTTDQHGTTWMGCSYKF